MEGHWTEISEFVDDIVITSAVGDCILYQAEFELTETSLKTEAGRDLSEVRPHPVTTALLDFPAILASLLKIYKEWWYLPTKEDEEEGRQTGKEVAE